MSRILITGAAGAVGAALLRLLGDRAGLDVVATDIRPPEALPPNARFLTMDVTGDDPDRVIAGVRPDVVVHLASVVTPGAGSTRDLEYAVDVTGSRNVLDACLAHGVRRLVVTSSGAAYGYHADNAVPLGEDDPIRGNREFAYSWHKRLVEEMLATARHETPALEQVVLRVGTVLGAGLENQITALFHKPRLLGLRGSDSPFVFIWDDDLAHVLERAALDGPPGIYNVAGDGAMTVSDIAAAMGKSVRWVPPVLVRAALVVARPLGLSRYGPEQVRFLLYRPVLDNTALKRDFGYVPRRSSAEAFARWWETAR
ncbi:SDR family oxidoreductase [Pukyongiella litopenaei]|uniref:SDR family oxidoreductase n=1 Tax=Pukyongiella litopenaei TaxID=2605946 RepID=A0A2S0MKF5_9RHOB|nr:SDR family oxidoreductase [Pukyongiella litopenaei]AVO36359.1 SDR family oxidoreductase [Pukyongiella litopenaei]